ncbi:MAG: hypothetical protein VX768_18765 [Planctomycetota bacterium]|mgnify:CR=1 FL=1|nr:hypothetical protein [Planctomycetota bacterium]
MDVIDRRDLCARILEKNGIRIRYESLLGAESGLCTIGGREVLMIEISLTSAEQLAILESTAKTLERQNRSVA